jgi:hypothetical protein
MDRIDITMTAMLRPSILKRTLEGIVNHIVDDQNRFRLIINIDPLGEKVKPGKVVKMAKRYFENVIYNISDEASFPKAVKWVWGKSKAPFIFHFEDDWLVNRDINIRDMIKILNNNEHLSSLRLYKYKTPRKKRFKTFSCMWIYNEEGFYVATDWKRQFGLNPILIKRKFIDEALPRMKDNVNPEKQFRSTKKYMVPIIRRWNYGIYTKPGNKPLITDIGRRWINKTKYRKPTAGKFLTWTKKQ